jgi:hypothetical protein
MADQISLGNLTIEHVTGQWGGPIAKVAVTAGPFDGRPFWLSRRGVGLLR